MKSLHLSFFSILLCLCLLLLIATNRTLLSAQIADYILRPLLGSEKTIALESVYFNSLDRIEKAVYPLTSHKEIVFAGTQQQISQKNIDAMNLTPLSPHTSLPHLSGEGVWQAIPLTLFPKQEVMAKTFVRPDIQRPYAVVSLVKMDMRQLSIGLQGGTYYPGGSRHMYGKGVIPLDIQKEGTLLAAFNGGFQEKDGEYGMILGKQVFVPLRKGLPALLLSASGSAQFVQYTGQTFPKNIVAIRQNGPYLVENGHVTPYVESGTDDWGRTITNSTYTWRSAIGVTKTGELLYAVGNSLIPKTLAQVLVQAGTVQAIQLDINPPWVRFVIYQPLGQGMYSYIPLLENMENGGYAYLHGYNKDFFYLYKK